VDLFYLPPPAWMRIDVLTTDGCFRTDPLTNLERALMGK